MRHRNRRMVQSELIVDAGARVRRLSADLMADQSELELLGNRLRARPAWTALTLLNSWTVYSGRTPGFLVDAFGFVHLRGVAAGGAAGTVMATLPAGRRPTMAQIFPVMTQLSTPPALDGAMRGQVNTNGDITLAINPPSSWVTGTWVDLSTITFRAEQ